MTTFRVSTVITPDQRALAWLMLKRAAGLAAIWLVLGFAWNTPGWALALGSALLAGWMAWLTWRREGPIYDLPDEDDDRYAEYAVTPEHDPEGPVL